MEDVPYVSTTLDVVWLGSKLPTYGYVYYRTLEAKLSDQDKPFFRLTPSVYRWFRRQLEAAERQAWAAEHEAAKDIVRKAAAAWVPLADWAEAMYRPEELAKAVPRLPQVTMKPLGDERTSGGPAARCTAGARKTGTGS